MVEAERPPTTSLDFPVRDGLTIGNAGSSMVQLEILGESGVLYSIDKFFYLGSTYSVYHPSFSTRKQAGLDSLRELRAASGTTESEGNPSVSPLI